MENPLNWKYVMYQEDHMHRISGHTQTGSGQRSKRKYYETLSALLISLDTDKLDAKIVEKIINLFAQHKNHYDIEQMHILEDKLSRRFINDVAEKKLDNELVYKIAQLIKSLNDEEYLKWYA